MQSHLQYLTRDQVDTGRWDQCIHTAANGLIYGYSWYLDGMARHWDALVWNDYEAVMPLTWNRKWGIQYIYTPPFVQQLGIFTKAAVTKEMETAFLNELPKRFRFTELFLNYAHPGSHPTRSNFICPLHGSYEQLRNNYRNVLLKNLKRAAHAGLEYTTQLQAAVVLDAWRELYGARFQHVRTHHYQRFKKICEQHPHHVVVRAAVCANALCSAVILLKDHRRLYLMVSVTWPAGKGKQANRFLLDSIFREFAGTQLLFDFEGSDIPGIAMYFKNFGAIDQPYYFYRYNRLPRLVKWLKS
jgi:hypothetical protein